MSLAPWSSRCVPCGAALACVLISALPPPRAAAQAPTDTAAAIALVRERYAAIQAARLDSSSVAYTSPGGQGTVTAWRAGGSLRKLTVAFDGDGASGLWEYFYWDDALQFVYHRWTRYPDEGPERVSEDRWYVAGGQVVRWLRTSEGGAPRAVRGDEREFANAAVAALAVAACWRRFAEAGVAGEAQC
jgi:hypothetical protein